MAIINCPECNNEMSDTASSCPKCGFNLKKMKGKEKVKKTTEGIKKKSKLIILGVLVVIVLALFITIMSLNSWNFKMVGNEISNVSFSCLFGQHDDNLKCKKCNSIMDEDVDQQLKTLWGQVYSTYMKAYLLSVGRQSNSNNMDAEEYCVKIYNFEKEMLKDLNSIKSYCGDFADLADMKLNIEYSAKYFPIYTDNELNKIMKDVNDIQSLQKEQEFFLDMFDVIVTEAKTTGYWTW